MNLLPGGYNFIHAIFWAVVAMVAMGTGAVPVMLTIGLGFLVVETLTNQ